EPAPLGGPADGGERVGRLIAARLRTPAVGVVQEEDGARGQRAGGPIGDHLGARLLRVEDAPRPADHAIAPASGRRPRDRTPEAVGRAEERAQGGGAERLGHRLLCPRELVDDVPVSAKDEDAMVVAVASKLMTFGGDAADERRVALDLAAEDEERRADPLGGEGVEHAWGGRAG